MEYSDIILPIVTAVIGLVIGRVWPILKGLAKATHTSLDDQLIAAIEKAVHEAVASTPVVQVASPPAATVERSR